MKFLHYFKPQRIDAPKGAIILDKRANMDSQSIGEGANHIRFCSSLHNCFLGYGSYIGNNSHFYNTIIGRYSSIGSDVQIIRGKHPIHFVSTHPAFYSTASQCGITYVDKTTFQELVMPKFEGKYTTRIGSDVWIGTSVRIIEGVEIGDGAVIAAGAVVTNDVPPYAIVGGVSSKIIKYRFDTKTIEKLLNLKWWNQDEDWIMKNAKYFSNVEKFLEMQNIEY